MDKIIVYMAVAQHFVNHFEMDYDDLIAIGNEIYAEFENQDKEHYASTFTFNYLENGGYDNAQSDSRP